MMNAVTVEAMTAVTIEATTAATVDQMIAATVETATNVVAATEGKNGVSDQTQNQRNRSKKRWRICADYTYSKIQLLEG